MVRPLYVGITSIYQNQNILLKTLKSIADQTRKPDTCFIFLSEEPYLLDKGFRTKSIVPKLKEYIDQKNWIQIKWVKNTGPYRKLIHLLEQFWEDDCLLITLDDDTVYHPQLLEQYEADYETHKCSIAYRGFRFQDKNFDYNNRGEPIERDLYNFATGKGGVVYHPHFFHKTGKLIFDPVGMAKVPTNDDIWFNFVRIAGKIPLVVINFPWQVKDLTKSDVSLFSQFNFKNNDPLIQACITYLNTLGYTFA
jgi:hypothetical protein